MSATDEGTVSPALLSAAQSVAGNIKSVRREIHANPELGLNNPATQAVIQRELARIGISDPKLGKKCSSVVAEIRGQAQASTRSRTVALRADMDALPLTEHNEADWASKNEGVMHACGHDGHVAMLLGAAEVLHGMRDRFAGTVRLLFQPGEEGYGGADVMLGEGALDGVDAAFALHLDSSSPTNIVATRRGAILAAADTFFVSFKGSGGHASLPYQGRDPIPAVGPFVDGLSHVAARETDPDDPVVFSVTMVRAGSAMNVLPPEAECSGTIRTLSHGRRETAHAQLRRVAEGVAAARGLEVEVRIARGYPPTINHDDGAVRMIESARGLNLRVHEMPSAMMGAEDFSYMLEKVPGAMAFLGCRTEGGGPLHSDLMKVDENALPTGAALHTHVALSFLGAVD